VSEFDRQKWNAKYGSDFKVPREPSVVLTSLERFLPSKGRGLDVAAGGGRHGIWLANRGLDVTLADVSSAGLAIAEQRAAEQGVAVKTVVVDMLDDPTGRDALGQWDVILSVCFLPRGLFPWFVEHLTPGGTLVVIQPTITNLERHDRPPRDFLLESGELRGLAGPLDVLHYEEGWLADDRHDAVLVARKV
jgi:tellurite methyltransferase